MRNDAVIWVFFEPYLKIWISYGLLGIILGLLIAVLSFFGIINQLLIGLTILCVSSIYVFKAEI